MNLLFILLLLAASTRVELVDQIYDIPAEQWRYFEITTKQAPVRVDGDFAVLGRDGVRIALLTRADLERLRSERPHGFLAATEFRRSGTFHYLIRTPGNYVMVLDNREQSTAVKTHVRVSLDFSPQPDPPRYLSPGRRTAAILISFGVFFGIVTWSARKLLRAIKG